MDVFSRKKRSNIMAAIKGSDTRPELIVRSLVYRIGYRFRLHGKELPGKPDIVLSRLKKVIFVHGCFWHGHKKCIRGRRPSSNRSFWNNKLDLNIARDKKNLLKLKKAGWMALVVWECELKKPDRLYKKLLKFLKSSRRIQLPKPVKMKHDMDLNSQCDSIKRLIANFEKELRSKDLRNKVVALVPILRELRKLGKNLISSQIAASARDRILHYFRKYPHIVISGDELFVVSGIQEYARRVRELRVQFGWTIINGVTAKAMAKEGEFPTSSINVSKMGPDDYVMLSEKEDKEAAYRWNVANEIRRKKSGVRDKILEYFLKNIGKKISGEELRYLAKDRSEWARRVRELRTEFGWPISTKNAGRPDLDVGVYVMESKRQSPEHDRQIPDPVRGAVLRRDGYKCTVCEWSHKEWNPSDSRHLELHHMKEHVKGGANTEGNLKTVCTVCHDDIHRRK